MAPLASAAALPALAADGDAEILALGAEIERLNAIANEIAAARTQKLSELAMSHPSVTHLSIPKVAILEGICRGVVIVDGIKAAPLL
ncbi:MAG: hypothetical protein ACHQAY_25735, partial [Hyphomicrobiales bacterium]